MRIGRAILIPAIVALGVAGSTLACSAITVAAAGNAPSVHANTVASTQSPGTYYHM